MSIEAGDKVRLPQEGVVAKTDRVRRTVCVNDRWYSADELEVIEKRAPVVGDILHSRAEFSRLPDRSVVVNGLGHPLIVRSSSEETINDRGRFHSFELPWSNPPYRVVYIPEG